jgi:flavin-dependent dehydrogenase
MLDVLIVGAGPAGSVAATILARAGVRVSVVDRATFPREKLCGDTLNPGTLAILTRLGLDGSIHRLGLRIDGMRVSGEGGVEVRAQYGAGVCGRAMTRADLDWLLLQQAMDAGAQFEPGVAARAPIVRKSTGDTMVEGVHVASAGRPAEAGRHRASELRARVTIAADGRHSTLAFGLGVARHPARPRRWAIGAYYSDVDGLSSLGEMHIRRGHYIGVAPVPGGLANACLVMPAGEALRAVRNPAALLSRMIARDPMLNARFARARLVRPPVVLGPLAVDMIDRPIDGLLLAGDAAGFIDPMTGDGLRFAVRGAELAAESALDVLAHGWDGVHVRLAARRGAEFGGKWRFNRALRAIVASPVAVRAAGIGARVTPSVLRALVRHAGDCDLA